MHKKKTRCPARGTGLAVTYGAGVGFTLLIGFAAGLRAGAAAPATSASAGTPSGSTSVMTWASVPVVPYAMRHAQAMPQAVRYLILAQAGGRGNPHYGSAADNPILRFNRR